MITDKDKAAFICGYLACALWSSSDTVDGQDVDLDDYEWADGEAETLHQDCHDFILEYGKLLERFVRRVGGDWSQAGHDFWLTRNGHGAGFWCRDTGAVGKLLTKRVGHGTPYSTVDLYLDDNDLVCSSDSKKVYAVQYRDMSTAAHYQLYFLSLPSALEAGRVVYAAEQTRHESWREIVGSFEGYVECKEINFRAPPVFWYDRDSQLHQVYCVNSKRIPDLY